VIYRVFASSDPFCYPTKITVKYFVVRRHVGKTRGRWEISVQRDALDLLQI
jgi:hypothetical protein